MVTLIAMIASSFCAGVVFGLIVSPSTERVQAAFSQGFLEGVAHMAKDAGE